MNAPKQGSSTPHQQPFFKALAQTEKSSEDPVQEAPAACARAVHSHLLSDITAATVWQSYGTAGVANL